MAEELETVLRLVAEGRLTPEEAAPIIDALTRAERARAEDDEEDAGWPDAWPGGAPVTEGLDRLGERISRRVHRRVERAHRRAERAFARADRHGRHAGVDHAGRGRQLRIRVTERGRQVVNLRIPIGFVETALRFVPGLGGDQAERIRDAVRAGAVGPILDVEDPDGEGGVLISVE
jgi:hypothetical protein